MVAQQGLDFIAQPETDRQIGLGPPVVLDERTGIPPDAADVRQPRLHSVARWPAAQLLDLRRREARLLQLQETDVLLQGGKTLQQRVAAGIGKDGVAGAQLRLVAARKAELSVEPRKSSDSGRCSRRIRTPKRMVWVLCEMEV